MGEALVDILDYFKLEQIVLLGEGAGANICARFAMKHQHRCLGLVLINPSGSAAGFFETMTDKVRFLNHFLIEKKKILINNFKISR